VGRKRDYRSEVVRVRMTPKEKKTFTALAESRGLDISNLTRQALYRDLEESKKKGQAA
jgi:hypothetical protein